jgi:riboflavin-specific deaminase-like protein
MDSWAFIPESFRSGAALLPDPWEGLFGPLRAGRVDDVMAVAQLGQSLDGRVATESGHSHYINGPAGLAHLHRLRALVDAVVIGIGTALADDPQLTVRRVSGPQPVRVVIDPNGRLRASARLLAKDGVRRIVLTAKDARPKLPEGVEIVGLPQPGGQIAPSAILAALKARGLRRILIEGGADTVSRFLAAGCLDRCEFGPNMVIYPEGVWYKYESTHDIDEILEVHVKNGGRVDRLMLQPDQLPPKH